MVEFYADGRFYVGLFMLAAAVAVYTLDLRSALARWLSLYFVIRGGLNAMLPFIDDTHDGFHLDLAVEITGHLHIGVAFSGLILAAVFGFPRATWARNLLILGWVATTAVYLMDSLVLWRGPLLVLVPGGSMAYVIMGMAMLIAARRTVDPLLRSGLVMAGLASWAFPAFAAGYDLGWLLYHLPQGLMPSALFLPYLVIRMFLLAGFGVLATVWWRANRARSLFLLACIGSGLLPWLGVLVELDAYELATLPNALTTLIMPIGLGLALVRLNIPNCDLIARRPAQVMLLGTAGAVIIAGLSVIFSQTDMGWLALLPIAVVAATTPWWNQWAAAGAKVLFPLIPTQLSVHARVQLFQSHYRRADEAGWPPGRRERIEWFAQSLGIPRWMVDRVGPTVCPLSS